jgi:hypothetical protein
MKLRELPKDYKDVAPSKEKIAKHLLHVNQPQWVERVMNDDSYLDLDMWGLFNFHKNEPYSMFWEMVASASFQQQLPPLEIDEGFNPGYIYGEVNYNPSFRDKNSVKRSRAIIKKGDLVDTFEFRRDNITNCGIMMFHNFRGLDLFTVEEDSDFLRDILDQFYVDALDDYHYALATHNQFMKDVFELNWENLKEVKNPNSGHKVNVWIYKR